MLFLTLRKGEHAGACRINGRRRQVTIEGDILTIDGTDRRHICHRIDNNNGLISYVCSNAEEAAQ